MIGKEQKKLPEAMADGEAAFALVLGKVQVGFLLRPVDLPGCQISCRTSGLRVIGIVCACFFFWQKETKRRFSYQSHAFFSDRHPISHRGEKRHRTTTTTPRNAARERNYESTTYDRNGRGGGGGGGGGGSSARGKQSGNTPFTLSFTRELIQKKGRRRVAFFFGNWEIKNLKKKISRGRKVSKRVSIFLCVSSFSESFRAPGDFDHQQKKKKKKKKEKK